MGGRRMLVDDDSEDSDAYMPSDGYEAMPPVDRDSHSQRGSSRRQRHLVSDDVEPGGFLQEEINDIGGSFLPDDEDHKDRGGDIEGGGFIDENDTTPDPTATESRSTTEIGPREKLFESSEPSIAPEQEANHQFQPPNVHFEDQSVKSTNSGLSTIKEGENASAFRIEEKHPGDNLGLTDAEIAEAVVLEEEYYGHLALKAGPPSEESPPEESKLVIEQGNLTAEVSSPKSSRGLPGTHETQNVEEEEEEEEEGDKGSLLSEDPSDEDAEPEWLV
ncbi:MAG: hypothetical protein Q9218_006447 [Villophora microphyllina]